MSYRRVNLQRMSRSAFSLTELMVVIVIIGLLAGAVAIGTRGYLAASRKGVAELELSKIAEALETYNGLEAGYPSADAGLEVLFKPLKSFDNGKLLKGDGNDPWGTPYEYVVPGPEGEPFEILCAGADKRFGTPDDLSNLDIGT